MKNFNILLNNTCNLHDIKEFKCNFKNLTSLDGVTNLKNLEVLNIEHNYIESIKELETLDKLKIIYLSFNPINIHDVFYTVSKNKNIEKIHIKGYPEDREDFLDFLRKKIIKISIDSI